MSAKILIRGDNVTKGDLGVAKVDAGDAARRRPDRDLVRRRDGFYFIVDGVK